MLKLSKFTIFVKGSSLSNLTWHGHQNIITNYKKESKAAYLDFNIQSLIIWFCIILKAEIFHIPLLQTKKPKIIKLKNVKNYETTRKEMES